MACFDDDCSGSANRPHPLSTLIVDDSPSVLATLCCTLARNHHLEIVGTAGDGLEALEMARRHRPQLVLLDVQMPRMNGITAASLLIRQLPGIQVIIMSLDDSAEIRRLCQEAGARAFISKTRLYHDLSELIASLAAERSGEAIQAPGDSENIEGR
jgi:two-component system nitrate/nitrite response regulator NarL